MSQPVPTTPALGTGRSPRPRSGAPVGRQPAAARPILRTLVSALVMCLVMLLGPGAAHAVPQPEDFDGTDTALRLDSLGPAALEPGGTLSAEITITNTSSQTLLAPQLEVRTRTPRITEREQLEQWQAVTAPDDSGTPVGTSGVAGDLAPGASTQVRVAIPAEELGYSEAPELWGVRRLSFTLVSEETPLVSLRSFTVWRPSGVSGGIRASMLVPISAADPAAQVTDPTAFTADVTAGALARTRDTALVDGVDWMLDPSLLDPATLVDPQEPEEEPTEDPDPDATAEPTTPAEEGTAGPPAPLEAADQMRLALQEGAAGRTVLGTPYAGADLVSLSEADAPHLGGRARIAAQDAWGGSGVTPHGQAVAVPEQQLTGGELQAWQEEGSEAIVVPSSLAAAGRSDHVTPSSVVMLESDAGSTPLIAPDEGLSAQVSMLTPESADPVLTRQRILAETAAVASQDVSARQHLVIVPEDASALDPEAVDAMMRDLRDAPWVERVPLSQLLDAAEQGSVTTDPGDESGAVLSAGTLRPEDVPVAEGAAAQRLDPRATADLEAASERLGDITSVMEDPAAADAAELLLLAAASTGHRGDEQEARQGADAAVARTDELTAAVQVVPVSEYTLVADAAGVPITVRNALPTPITVQVLVSSDTHVVRIGDPETVRVPARGSAQVTVPVEAIANGTVTLSTTLTTAEGVPLTDPVGVPLSVNPAWENWTTMALVIAMGLLVVVGVLRARRTGSSRRAPGVKVPEDPAVLASTGRSQPAAGTMDPPRPGTEGQEEGR
ncbi:DUF6049 family protein [Brachybacterium phenoliresistens]|uniref:DUF6049 family protein n=1 Tax=Brachybacterium phenoliresistens TaxID=396014 RepID=UPI0031D5DCDC